MSDTKQSSYQRPPDAIADLIDAPGVPHFALSPCGRRAVVVTRPDLPSLADIARDEMKLAGIRFDPKLRLETGMQFWPGPTVLKDLTSDNPLHGEIPIENLPVGSGIQHLSWNADGTHIAFLLRPNLLEDKVEIWVAEVVPGINSKEGIRCVASPLVQERVPSGVTMSPVQWIRSQNKLLCAVVPENHGDAPTEPRIPSSPRIETSDGSPSPARSYQDLIKSAHDETLFRHYATATLLVFDISTKKFQILGPARGQMYRSVQFSPDGFKILVSITDEPFSHMVTYGRFARRIEVWHLNHPWQIQHEPMITTVLTLPSMEKIPISFDARASGPRSIRWHECKQRTVVFVEATDGGNPKTKIDEEDPRDLLFFLEEPYAYGSGKRKIFGTKRRISSVSWTADGTTIVTDRWRKTRCTSTWIIPAEGESVQSIPQFDRQYEDIYSSPGVPMQKWKSGRRVILQTSKGLVALSGNGASPNGARPFLDWMELGRSFKTVRKWRCRPAPKSKLKAAEDPFKEVGGVIPPDSERCEVYETLVKVIDDNRIVIRRETPTVPPNFYLLHLDSSKEVPITSFAHPQPSLKEVKKSLITYKRRDGVQLDAELYLPPGYTPDDGPRPCLMWAYPREFKSKQAAGQVKDSPYRFVRTGWSRPLPWLLRGYVVLEKFAVPIIGENNAEPNDTYIEQLIMSAEAAVDEVVKRGVARRDQIAVGGHSYGGFMTAHLVAHTNLFRAGIARSGAYNRSLTPFGFQGEERTFWEAPEVYMKMSPFSHAQKIADRGTPLLLIHGEADQNPGTFPLQSERLFGALKGLGAVSRLVVLPLEVHGYRARESIMHTLYEQDNWLKSYVETELEKSVSEEMPTVSFPNIWMLVTAFGWATAAMAVSFLKPSKL